MSVLMLSVSGCRGVVGQTLTPETIVRFAGSYGAWLRRRAGGRVRVVLGRDGSAVPRHLPRHGSRRAMTTPASSAARLPTVVVDLEKLRHINSGLGRFALHLGRELVAVAEGRFNPVLFLPPGGDRHFENRSYVRQPVVRWRKESFQRTFRPFVRPFLRRSGVSLWHTTNQHSRYLPLDDRVPVLLTIHDLNFLHEARHGQPAEWIDRQRADVQARVDRAEAITTVSSVTTTRLSIVPSQQMPHAIHRLSSLATLGDRVMGR
jgi:hypothetical protein